MPSAAIPRPYRLSPHPLPGTHCLARVRFGATPIPGGEPHEVNVPLALLDGAADEYWLSATPVQRGSQDGLGYAENGAVLFGRACIGEDELERQGVEAAVFQTYARIDTLLLSRGYPHGLRFWNYLSRITEGEADVERYRQFNVGRARALKRGGDRRLPAATAIGSPGGGGLLVYFLAARETRGVAVENPRQVPALEYPRQYGPKSPNFARATRVEWHDGGDLLVSGTASVVGHETRHPHALAAQLEETFANLDALVAEAANQRGQGRYTAQSYRFYLSRPEALPQLLPRLRAYCGAADLVCLQGDICRRDLLLEIEGVYASERLNRI